AALPATARSSPASTRSSRPPSPTPRPRCRTPRSTTGCCAARDSPGYRGRHGIPALVPPDRRERDGDRGAAAGPGGRLGRRRRGGAGPPAVLLRIARARRVRLLLPGG